MNLWWVEDEEKKCATLTTCGISLENCFVNLPMSLPHNKNEERGGEVKLRIFFPFSNYFFKQKNICFRNEIFIQFYGEWQCELGNQKQNFSLCGGFIGCKSHVFIAFTRLLYEIWGWNLTEVVFLCGLEFEREFLRKIRGMFCSFYHRIQVKKC